MYCLIIIDLFFILFMSDFDVLIELLSLVELCLVYADATLFHTNLTWNDANQYCQSIDQQLINIDRQAKYSVLERTLSFLTTS